MTAFSRLALQNWRQFGSVEVNLDKQVTVLTGQNGTGKTTLLNILSHHFGWSLNFVASPSRRERRLKKLWSDIFDPDGNVFEDDQTVQVGTITYSDGRTCNLTTKTHVSPQYKLNYVKPASVPGMHIPSHRPVAVYTPVPTIPTDPATAASQYQTYQQLLVQMYGAGSRENPGKVQKQSIISLAVLGEGNSSVVPNPEAHHLLQSFEKVLQVMMPASIGFKRLLIRMPDVICVTESGDFALDAMSGGINSIFSIAWQLHMFGHGKESFTVTIDEPENHLHPSMQRSLLPKLAKAFPSVRIIAATHSPFIVSSFAEANIYSLARDPQGRVRAHKLDETNVSGTPNEVLREILDVKSNLPIWVERKVAEVIKDTESLPIAERASKIMQRLSDLGIADAIMEYGSRGNDEKDEQGRGA